MATDHKKVGSLNVRGFIATTTFTVPFAPPGIMRILINTKNSLAAELFEALAAQLDSTRFALIQVVVHMPKLTQQEQLPIYLSIPRNLIHEMKHSKLQKTHTSHTQM
jgi:hypothetical protein